MAKVSIAHKVVGHSEPAFIVAELGINHNGDIQIAKKLIDKAVEAGADAVKFQKRTVDIVFSPGERDKPREVPRFIIENAIARGVLPQESVKRLKASDFKDTRNGDQKYALEFTKEEYAEIDRYCKEKGILWFASPWDEEAVDFLEEFDPPAYKIASASLTDDGLLRHIRSKGRPVILSTGMSNLAMVRHAVEVLGTNDLVVLQCTGVYPKAESERMLSMINLRGIHTLQKEFPNVPVGFSGNDSGIVPTFAAVAMGAVLVEKHLTLERGMWGSDQASSVEPGPFLSLCRWIREHHISLGDGEKNIHPEEVDVIKKLRRK
ncbi:MAG: N-acetylneuraminate synthase family protein [bacterium]|nr:N-acetylneuraminate synthase family protein [bacterium]